MLAPTKKLPAAGSLNELIYVALPLMISSGSVSLMQAVDRVFLTWYSHDALAAALPAGVLNWTILSIAFGTAGYVNTFVAQYDGSGQHDNVADAVWQGVYFSLFASVLMLVFIPLAPPIFRWAGHAPAVQQLEVEYFSVLFWGAGPMVLSAALSSFYSGRGQTQFIMIVNIIGALANAVLDYVLIFGKFGFPEMGIRGAAVGTVLASVLTVILYALHMIFGRDGRAYRLWPPRRLNFERLRRLIWFGLPSGMSMFIELACFAVFIQVVGRAGVAELAATNLAFNINALAFVPMLGLGTAIMTLVGQRIGEGRPDLAVRTTMQAFAIAGTYMGIFAVMYVTAPGLMLLAYKAENAAEFAQIERHVIVLLRYLAIFAVFDGMAVVFGAAIRGAGDTRFAMAFNSLCGIVLMVTPTYIAYRYWGGGLDAAWISCTAYIVVLGTGLALRFYQGRWKSMKVIEHTANEVAVA